MTKEAEELEDRIGTTKRILKFSGVVSNEDIALNQICIMKALCILLETMGRGQYHISALARKDEVIKKLIAEIKVVTMDGINNADYIKISLKAAIEAAEKEIG